MAAASAARSPTRSRARRSGCSTAIARAAGSDAARRMRPTSSTRRTGCNGCVARNWCRTTSLPEAQFFGTAFCRRCGSARAARLGRAQRRGRSGRLARHGPGHSRAGAHLRRVEGRVGPDHGPDSAVRGDAATRSEVPSHCVRLRDPATPARCSRSTRCPSSWQASAGARRRRCWRRAAGARRHRAAAEDDALGGNAADAPLRLHTITFSHYVEKVRWCMDRLGIPYEEVPNAGILGVLLTRPHRAVARGPARADAHRRLAAYPSLPVGRVLRVACRSNARAFSSRRRGARTRAEIRPSARQRRAGLGLFADLPSTRPDAAVVGHRGDRGSPAGNARCCARSRRCCAPP